MFRDRSDTHTCDSFAIYHKLYNLLLLPALLSLGEGEIKEDVRDEQKKD